MDGKKMRYTIIKFNKIIDGNKNYLLTNKHFYSKAKLFDYLNEHSNEDLSYTREYY